MPRASLDLLPRALKAQRDENLMLLWTLLRSRMRVTPHDVRLALSDAQWQRFETRVCHVLTDLKPVSESTLREYTRLLKIGDDLFKKIHSTRALRKRTPAWHALRAQMGDCYSHAAAELARVISKHPTAATLLFPTPQFPQLAFATRLGLGAGDMPRVKTSQPAPLEEPLRPSDQWQEATFGFVQELMRKKNPKAAAFQDDAVQGNFPSA